MPSHYLQTNKIVPNGTKFHRLTIINWIWIPYVYNNKTKRCRWYICKCTCETIIHSRKHALVAGKTKSCGCYIKNFQQTKYLKNRDQSNINGLFYSYQVAANKRNYEFSLTKENFAILVKKNCHYCNSVPSRRFLYNKKLIQTKGYENPYLYNGIDRVNNELGYTTENSVSACELCNQAKHTMTLTQFKQWVERIYSYMFEEVRNNAKI